MEPGLFHLHGNFIQVADSDTGCPLTSLTIRAFWHCFSSEDFPSHEMLLIFFLMLKVSTIQQPVQYYLCICITSKFPIFQIELSHCSSILYGYVFTNTLCINNRIFMISQTIYDCIFCFFFFLNLNLMILLEIWDFHLHSVACEAVQDNLQWGNHVYLLIHGEETIYITLNVDCLTKQGQEN